MKDDIARLGESRDALNQSIKATHKMKGEKAKTVEDKNGVSSSGQQRSIDSALNH